MAVKTVLIADDDQALATAIALRCKELGVHSITCPDGIKAYQAIVQQPPDLMILDLNMPGAGGLYLFEELAREQGLAPIPAIILTGKSDEATVQRCKRLGVHYVWKGLDTWDQLKPIVCKLLDLVISAEQTEGIRDEQVATERVTDSPDRSTTTPKVLVVDDDPDISKAIQIRLQKFGIQVARAFNGMQGYWTALKEQPDLIIMDYHMPEGYGNYLLGRLQSHTLTNSIPVIVLTGQHIGNNKDYALERELLSLGATAFLTKPLEFESLLKELCRHMSVPSGGPPSQSSAVASRVC